MKRKNWTKRCKCGNFIPDEYEICDWCLLDKYNLKGRRDSQDSMSLGPTYYTEEDVVTALRKAEKEVK